MMEQDRIDFGGFSIAIDMENWPAKIVRALLRRHYEKNERQLLKTLLEPNDRVLELGSALGVIALAASQRLPASNVFCYDANPDMVAEARQNFATNNAEITASNTVLLPERTKSANTITFYKTPYFLSSSLLPHRDDMQPVEIATATLEDAIAKHQATCLIIDIEGGEFDLLAAADLSGIEKLSLELHLSLGDDDKCAALISNLVNQGLHPDAELITDNVFVFSRHPAHPASDAFMETYLESLSAVKAGDKARALQQISAASALSEHNCYALQLKADLQRAGGDLSGALLTIEEAHSSAPQNADACEQRADLLSRSGRTDEITEAYERAIAADPYRPLFKLGLGVGHQKQGNSGKALAAFEAAAALLPPRSREFSTLVSIALRQDKFKADNAASDLPRSDNLNQRAVLSNLADIVAERFRFADAGAALKTALALAPQAHGLHCAVAQLLATPQDIRDAMSTASA